MDLTSLVEGRALDRPSLFEILAQEHMGGLLESMIRFALTHTLQRFPSLALPVLPYMEEAVMAAHLLTQRGFLMKYAGTLSEYFYGLKRVRNSATGAPASKVRPSAAS